MKKILLSLLLILMISCKHESARDEATKALPEALKDKTYSRGSSRGDLVDELYQELVSKSADLQKLEAQIENFETSEVQKKFYNYNTKSENYYASVTNQARMIKDSVTRTRILAFIEKSNKKYFDKSNELRSLSNTITDKQKSIEDCHTVLKIVLTLPIITNYQNHTMPVKKEFEDKIKSEDSLIHAIHNKTPKY